MIKSAIIYGLINICIDKLFGGLFQATKTLALSDLSHLINKQFKRILCHVNDVSTPFYGDIRSNFNSIYHLKDAKIVGVNRDVLEVVGKGIIFEIKFNQPQMDDIYFKLCSKNDNKYPFDIVTRNRNVIYISLSSWSYRLFVDRNDIIAPEELK